MAGFPKSTESKTMQVISGPSFSPLPPNIPTTAVPADHIVLNFCQSILYGTIGDR